MHIMNSQSYYMKRLGTSDQYETKGSFGSSENSAATESGSSERRLSTSGLRRSSCRTSSDGYDQFILTQDAEEECFKDIALIVTNKTRMH